MSDHLPLEVSDALVAPMGKQIFLYHQDPIPHKSAVVVVRKHRGFLDVPLLMVALGQPIPIACDHYIGQVAVMRVGCPADGLFLSIKTRTYTVGVVTTGKSVLGTSSLGWGFYTPKPLEIGKFNKGFTHLVLWTSVKQAAPRLKRDRFSRRNRTLSDNAAMVTFV